MVVGSLERANALELRFGADGQSLEIYGVRVENIPTQGLVSFMLLVLALATAAACMLRGNWARLRRSP